MDRAQSFRRDAIPARVGVAVHPERCRTLLAAPADMGWFEIHAERFMGKGDALQAPLAALRERYPLSVHGVGLSIGAARPLDAAHLRRLKCFLDRYEPSLFSEHLAWSTHDGMVHGARLPMPYDERSLARVCEHVDEVQNALRRRILLENPATHVVFLDSSMNEIEFLAVVAERTGCGLLLDVNSLEVSAASQRWDPVAYVDSFPMHLVGEMHVTAARRHGHSAHLQPIDPGVMALCARAISRAGAVPTLLAGNRGEPSSPVLAEVARRLDALLSDADASEAFRFALAG